MSTSRVNSLVGCWLLNLASSRSDWSAAWNFVKSLISVRNRTSLYQYHFFLFKPNYKVHPRRGGSRKQIKIVVGILVNYYQWIRIYSYKCSFIHRGSDTMFCKRYVVGFIMWKISWNWVEQMIIFRSKLFALKLIIQLKWEWNHTWFHYIFMSVYSI